jgi:DNA-directed RNA polymerase specialized sigma24 family protein
VEYPTEALTVAPDARQHVAALYQAHALALVKLAVLMTGDQPTAEDVVQDAFLGLYRRWQALHDAENALGYLRSSVLNGCRSVHRVRFRRQAVILGPTLAATR